MKVTDIKDNDLLRITDKQDGLSFFCVAKRYAWGEKRLDYHAALMHGRFIMEDYVYLCSPIVEFMTEEERQLFIEAAEKENEKITGEYKKATSSLNLIKQTLQGNGAE